MCIDWLVGGSAEEWPSPIGRNNKYGKQSPQDKASEPTSITRLAQISVQTSARTRAFDAAIPAQVKRRIVGFRTFVTSPRSQGKAPSPVFCKNSCGEFVVIGRYLHDYDRRIDATATDGHRPNRIVTANKRRNSSSSESNSDRFRFDTISTTINVDHLVSWRWDSESTSSSERPPSPGDERLSI